MERKWVALIVVKIGWKGPQDHFDIPARTRKMSMNTAKDRNAVAQEFTRYYSNTQMSPGGHWHDFPVFLARLRVFFQHLQSSYTTEAGVSRNSIHGLE